MKTGVTYKHITRTFIALIKYKVGRSVQCHY